MLYGVKVILTQTVGIEDRRFYEELILTVNAKDYDEAYEKAEEYMQGYDFEYVNIFGENVKTFSIEAINCFLAVDPMGDVQEVFSSFSTNRSNLSEDDYYRLITSQCEEKELRPLRNSEYNRME